MIRTTFAVVFSLVSTCAMMGCAGAQDTPSAQSPLPVAAPTGLAGSLSLWGNARLHLDPDTLTATAEVLPARGGAANDDLYALSIDNFLTPDSFRIRRVEVDGADLAITYHITHPFPAPQDPLGVPNGSTNRADLGVTGMALFLIDVPSATGNTFFADVVCDTSLITNADAYYRPAGLLTPPASVANTFPYLSFVDETGPDGSRVDVANGGVTGNFGTDGWTRSELGVGNAGWTGYGALHQGQASERTLRVDLAALQAAGPLTLDVALIAKYNDPRGGATAAEKKANRLPPAAPDASRFAYRMPHGALDVERLIPLGESGGFEPDTISASTLRFRVVDWDARATETTAGDLSGDIDFNTVSVGESGLPQLAICIPGVLGDATTIDTWDATTLIDDDTPYGGDLLPDSGQLTDALFYEKIVTKTAGSGQNAGTYTGMIRVTDPEPASLIVPLDPGTLAPLAANLPQNITYQAFTVNMQGGASAGWAQSHGATGNELVNGVHVTSSGDMYLAGSFAGTVDFGGGARIASGSTDAWLLKLDGTGGYLWDNVFGGTGSDQVNRIATDSTGNVLLVGLFNASCDFGTGTPLVSAGSTDAYIAKYDPSGGALLAQRYGGTGADSSRGVAADSSNNIILCGSAVGAVDFGGGPVTGAGLADGWLLKIDPIGGHQFSLPLMGTSIDFAQQVATASTGEIYVAGEARSVNFGTGLICNSGGADGYVARYTAAGAIQWVQWWGSTLNDLVDDMTLDPVDASVYVGGPFSNSLTFGGATVNSAGGFDGYLVKYNAAGAYQWEYLVRSSSSTQDRVTGIALAPNQQVTICGVFANDFDFGGGNRVHSTFVEDAYVVQLSPAGVWTWDAIVTGTNDQSPRDVAADAVGDLRIGGVFEDSADFDPGAGVTTLTAGGTSLDAFAMKLKAATGRF